MLLDFMFFVHSGERMSLHSRGRPKFTRLPPELSQCLKTIASSPGTSATWPNLAKVDEKLLKDANSMLKAC